MALKLFKNNFCSIRAEVRRKCRGDTPCINDAPIEQRFCASRPYGHGLCSYSAARCDTPGIDASIEDNFCSNRAEVQQKIEHVLIRAELRQKQNCCSNGGSVGDTLGITSARMKNKLFLNNFCSIRAEHIPSVSPSAELLLDSSRSYPRLKHRFPVCHIAQQNTSITYARTVFT